MPSILIGPCVSFLQCVVVNCLETALVKYASLDGRSGVFVLLQTVTRIEQMLEEQKKAKVHAALQHLRFALNHLHSSSPLALHQEKELSEEMKLLTRGCYRKDYTQSALTYFENCISCAIEALNNNPSLEDRILLIEAMSMSQLLSEDLPGVKKNISDSLCLLSKHGDVTRVYYTLNYTGCLAGSWEVSMAKAIFRLHYYFRTLLDFIPWMEDFLVRLERSEYHPQGADVRMVDPLDPPMLIRSALRHGEAGAKMVAAGVTMVPLSVGAGLLVSGWSIAMSPVAIPWAGFEVLYRNSGSGRSWSRYWKETQEDFKECMTRLGKAIASPILLPHKMIGTLLSDEFGQTGKLQWKNGEVHLNAKD